MFQKDTDWTPRFEKLGKVIRAKARFEETIELVAELHDIVHFSEMSNNDLPSYSEDIWEGLTEEQFSIMPTKRDVTIAWNIWHITRIEDLVANLLIRDDRQVLNAAWLEQLGITVTDTGNAMSDPEIIALSQAVDKEALRQYRNAVGRQTRELLLTLTMEDLARKPKQESLDRLVSEGGLTLQKESIWLKDFWGKKTVAGLLLLPITRHHIMHLDDCVKLREKIL